ncbi:hypothetical protein CLOM_g20056, partial [Closterium sp. NIES-68]
LPPLPELALRLPSTRTSAAAVPPGSSKKGLGDLLKDPAAGTSDVTSITLLGKRKFAFNADLSAEAGARKQQLAPLPSLLVPSFLQNASAIPPPLLVDSISTSAAAVASASAAPAPAVVSGAPPKQPDKYSHLSPRSNLRHQAADGLRRILSSWCAKLALRGPRVVDLALHVLQRALKSLPLGSVDSTALRVLLAACLWAAAKLDGRQTDVPKGAAMSAVSLVEVGVLLAAELQLMKMMNWQPLEGFEA